MYTFQSQVRYSELDSDRKLSIASIVDYFQDCSTFHSETLGVGIDYLDRVGMLWVMSYWQIVIDRSFWDTGTFLSRMKRERKLCVPILSGR